MTNTLGSVYGKLNRNLALSKRNTANSQVVQHYNNPASSPVSKPVSRNIQPQQPQPQPQGQPSSTYSVNYGGTDYAVNYNPNNNSYTANVNGSQIALTGGQNNMVYATNNNITAPVGQLVSDGDGSFSIVNNPQHHHPQPQPQGQPSSTYSVNYGGTDYAVTYNPNNNSYTANVNGSQIALTGGQNNMVYATNNNITTPVGQLVSDGDGTFSVLA